MQPSDARTKTSSYLGSSQARNHQDQQAPRFSLALQLPLASPVLQNESVDYIPPEFKIIPDIKQDITAYCFLKYPIISYYYIKYYNPTLSAKYPSSNIQRLPKSKVNQGISRLETVRFNPAPSLSRVGAPTEWTVARIMRRPRVAIDQIDKRTKTTYRPSGKASTREGSAIHFLRL
jgi:hypothetical protein